MGLDIRSASPIEPIAPLCLCVAAAVRGSQLSCRSRCYARLSIMHFTDLPFSVLLLHLLDFLPLGSAACIAAAAHFPDVAVQSFYAYVRSIKRTCRQKLGPLLALGFNAPCLSFRHQPALLWDPRLRPSACSWHAVGGDRVFVQREDEVEATICRLAASYLHTRGVLNTRGVGLIMGNMLDSSSKMEALTSTNGDIYGDEGMVAIQF